MSSGKGKEKAIAGYSGLPDLHIPELHLCKKADEERIEKLLVIVHWRSHTRVPKTCLPRMIPDNMGFPAPQYAAGYEDEVEDQVAVGLIYGTRPYETPEYASVDHRVPPKITKLRVLILTSGEALQGLQFRGPNTEMQVVNPFTNTRYRARLAGSTEQDSGIYIIACDDWDQDEAANFRFPEFSARREHPDQDRELRYIGLKQDATTHRWSGFKSQAFFEKTYKAGAIGPRPPISLGAPVITKAGNVCAIVVKVKDDGVIAIHELNDDALRCIEHAGR